MKSRQQLMIFIEKQKTAFIASVDEEGFPTVLCLWAQWRYCRMRKLSKNYGTPEIRCTIAAVSQTLITAC